MKFFFYGTLQAGSANPVIRAVHSRLVPQGRARIAGRLVALFDSGGWYPALLAGEGLVHGQVFAAGPDFTAADLAALDRYEEYDPSAPETSWYLREVWPLIGGDQVTLYRMNGTPSADAVPIPGGDFKAWIAATGRPEFAGRHDG